MVFGRKKVYFNLLDEKEIVFRTPGRNLISFQVQLRNISIEIEFVQNVFGLIFDKTHEYLKPDSNSAIPMSFQSYHYLNE